MSVELHSNKAEKKDDGVSPVVGVMLMLVVTVILAAVVSLFATGLVEDYKKPSIAILKCNECTVTNGSLDSMVFTHMGGDQISTADLTLLISTSDKTGMVALNKLTPATVWSAGMKLALNDVSENLDVDLGKLGSCFSWSIREGTGYIIAQGRMVAQAS